MTALLFTGTALGQGLACNPSAPRSDSGAGFKPFGAREQALARAGHGGRAWEWALGTDTNGSQKVQGSLDWVSGKAYGWTLTYDGSGAATLQMRDAGALVLSLSYPSGMDAGNALQVRVATNASLGSGTTISASTSSINGKSASGAVSQTGNNQDSAQSLYFYYPPMSQGFTASGTVSLSYASLPAGGRVQFTVKAGNIPCTNQPPTVSLSAPAAESVHQAGSTLTVSAHAADADGSVQSVEFLANGRPLGADSTSPYSIDWTNLPPGSYSLAARATDNAGDQTLSSAVAITVNVQPTVAITSPANNSVFDAPASVPISTIAADLDGTINRIELYANGSRIATLTSAPYSFTWTNVGAGTYALTAKAVDNNNYETLSAAVTITVRVASTLYFIHADYLNTPRLIENQEGQPVWRRDNQEPFGDSPADENPSGLGIFEFDFGFPGQRRDRETGGWYNYLRDCYDPATGRYCQSDPIGLRGGMNTYVYVLNPLTQIDPFGLMGRAPGGSGPGGPRFSGSSCGPQDDPKNYPANFGFGNFNQACISHDNCYSVCGANKTMCDLQFGVDILASTGGPGAVPGMGIFALGAQATFSFGYFVAVFATPTGMLQYKKAQAAACQSTICVQ